MGNCQAAEAATVVIQHPPAAGNSNNTKSVDRIYWSVRAHEVMNSNPGHYVALVVNPPSTENGQTPAAKQVLKLLKPDDTLLIGQVYRLISFEDVLKEFATKKSVKLGKLLKERGGGTTTAAVRGGGGMESEIKRRNNSGEDWSSSAADTEEANQQLQLGITTTSSFNGGGGSSGRVVRRQHYYNYGGGQWRPALQSISEIA